MRRNGYPCIFCLLILLNFSWQPAGPQPMKTRALSLANIRGDFNSSSFEFATLNCPFRCFDLAPPVNHKSYTLFRAFRPRRKDGFGEQESQSGTIRADPAGVRTWGRNDPGGGPETGGAPARGAEGAG